MLRIKFGRNDSGWEIIGSSEIAKHLPNSIIYIAVRDRHVQPSLFVRYVYHIHGMSMASWKEDAVTPYLTPDTSSTIPTSRRPSYYASSINLLFKSSPEYKSVKRKRI